MDWDDLRFILAICRDGTLTKAAASLGVTHTTVGRRVRAVEDQLGVRLFDRTPEGFLPTPAGQDIEQVAERLESEVLSLEGRVLGRDAQLSGKLRVSTLDFIYVHNHDVFSSFCERYPSVELTVTTPHEQVSLSRREADVALRLSNHPGDQLVGRRVARMAFAVYGARSLVDRIGHDAPLEAFPWLHWDDTQDVRWLDDWLAKNAPGAKVVMRIDANTMVLRHSMLAGIGVHFMPCFDGDAHPDLVRLSPIQRDYDRDLWLVTLPDLRANLRVRAFMEHVGEALHARRAAFAGEPDATTPGDAITPS